MSSLVEESPPPAQDDDLSPDLVKDFEDGYVDLTPCSVVNEGTEEEAYEYEDDLGSLLKKTLVISPDPSGPTPQPGDMVKAHYTGTLLDGTKFDSSVDRGQPFEFQIGVGSVIRAWDVGMATMRKGEKAIFKAKPAYAYGVDGNPPAIPENATLIFEVELLSFKEKEKEKWEMSVAERRESSLKRKEDATAFFKDKRWAEAAEEYDEAADFVMDMQHENNPDDEYLHVDDSCRDIYVSCKLNAAMCYVKARDGSGAVRVANCVLDFEGEGENLKAIFRRGCGYKLMQEWKKAKEDLLRANKLAPSDKAIRKEVRYVVSVVVVSALVCNNNNNNNKPR